MKQIMRRGGRRDEEKKGILQTQFAVQRVLPDLRVGAAFAARAAGLAAVDFLIAGLAVFGPTVFVLASTADLEAVAADEAGKTGACNAGLQCVSCLPFMNQLTLCSRLRAVATHRTSFSRNSQRVMQWYQRVSEAHRREETARWLAAPTNSIIN
jgi:hypothetical protein